MRKLVGLRWWRPGAGRRWSEEEKLRAPAPRTHDKRVAREPHQYTVPKKALVAEQDRLAQNDGDKGNVNRIAHVAISTIR